MSRLRKLSTIAKVRIAVIISAFVILGLRLPENLGIINTILEITSSIFRGTIAGTVGIALETIALLLLVWPRSRAVTYFGICSLTLLFLGFAYFGILVRTAIDGFGLPVEPLTYMVMFLLAFLSLFVFLPDPDNRPRHAPNQHELARVIALSGKPLRPSRTKHTGRHRT